MNLDFQNAQFEHDEEIQIYSKEFMAQKRDEMRHVKQFEQIKAKLPIKVVSRPSSAHSHKDESVSRHTNYLKKNNKGIIAPSSQVKQNNITDPFPNSNKSSLKSVKFSNTYFNPNTPVIRQEYSEKFNQGNPKKYQSKALDWEDEDIEDHFFIKQEQLQSDRGMIEYKNHQNLLTKLNTLKPTAQTPQANRQPTASSKSTIQNKSNKDPYKSLPVSQNQIIAQQIKKVPQKQQPTTPNQIIAQQIKQIQVKKESIQQLKMNDIIQNKLVISSVPKASDDEYGNDKFEDQEPNYEQEFEPEVPPQPQQIMQKQESKSSLQRPQSAAKIVTDQNKPITSNIPQSVAKVVTDSNKPTKLNIKTQQDIVGQTQEITRPEVKTFHRQQKLQITEDQLLLKNEVVQSQFKIWKEIEEKERTMVDIQNKRKEQLQLAQYTLKSLEEQIKEQKIIIETLSRKEEYSTQIIQHLKSKTCEHSKVYSSKVRQIQAGVIILHWLKMFRDRRRFIKIKSEKQL